MRRLWIPITAVALVGLIFWSVWWASPTRQARAWVARVTTAVAERDAAALVAEAHPAYDIGAHWPILAELPGGALGGGDQRQQAQRLLAMILLQPRDAPLRLTLNPRQIQVLPDGRVAIRAELALGSDAGGLRIGPQRDWRVVLARDGWSPRLRAIEHDAVDVTP